MLERLQKVFRDVFVQPGLILTERTSALDVDGWDSLSNAILLLELEREFGVAPTSDQMARFKNVGELAAFLAARTRSAH